MNKQNALMTRWYVLMATVVVLLFCGTASATTIHVNETGWYRSGGAFNATGTPIQHAVDNASSYDTVYIWNGSYTENVDISTAHLTIEGEGRDVVTITASDTSDDIINIHAAYGNVSGICATGATTSAGIYTDCDYCNISYNDVQNNDIGIVISSSNSVINNNTASSNSWSGIDVIGSTDNTITNNTLTSNTYYGIYLSNSDSNIITNNIANSHTGYYGFLLSSSDNNVLTSNTGNLNAVGIKIQSSSINNTLTSNNMSSNTCWGIQLDTAHDSTFTSNTANGNIYDGIKAESSNNNTFTNNIANSNNNFGILLYDSNYNNTFTNNIANSNDHSGIYFRYSDNNTLTNENTNSNDYYGIWMLSSSNNIFTNHTSTGNVRYDHLSYGASINNTLLNCNLDNTTSFMNDSTSQWIIKYTDGSILDTGDPDLSMTCYADNCTLTLEPTTNDYTLNMTTLDVTVSASTGSVSVAANSTLVSIDYENTTINDLNITALDRQLILESAGVQTMVFNPTNIFNLWDFEYYINATANRKAVAFNTYTTNATNLINFTFYDLYPSSNFDCKYNSISFTTNISGTTGTLEFNKSSWTANVTRAVKIYMTTTPYRCDGVCAVSEGDPMMLYLDLNDTTVTNVRAEITKPNGEKANNSMTDFLDNGDTSWYLNYADTGNAGTYNVNNFYSSKDGLSWKQLDSFLTFESRSTSGGGGGGSVPEDGDEADGEDGVPEGAGGGAQPEPTPTPEPAEEEHAINPDKQHTADLTTGQATFTNSIVTRVATNQSGTIQIDEFKINPTTTSLIGGTRYGYADIAVPNRNIGGTVCFAAPTTDTSVSIYHLEDNEWVELKTTNGGAEVCADTGHFSYFALADEAMESVIESMTQLSFDYPKVDGIMLWKWLSNMYTSTHIANRELTNVSASDGVICEILTTGDYPNRTLKCTYTPPKDAEWSSLKYQGEVIAVDTEGYTRRIPVKLSVYNMGKLAFPILAGLIVFGGFILYRYPPKRTW